jgi:hypothetical protein
MSGFRSEPSVPLNPCARLGCLVDPLWDRLLPIPQAFDLLGHLEAAGRPGDEMHQPAVHEARLRKGVGDMH